MSLAQLITTRRSISQFQSTPLPSGLIEKLLEVAISAPNHRMTEPWRFVIIEADARRSLADVRRRMAVADGRGEGYAEKLAMTLNAIPAFLLVIQTQADDPLIRQEDYAACCCLAQNFMLLAWEQGVGSIWKTFANDPLLRDLLELAPNEQIAAVLFLGYPAQVPEAPVRKPAHSQTTYLTASVAE